MSNISDRVGGFSEEELQLVQEAAKNRGENKKRREVLQNDPREIGKVYLHIDNGGVSFQVVNEGWGPTVKVKGSSFGHLTNSIRLHTDRKSLRALGQMFLDASNHSDYTEEYCNKATILGNSQYSVDGSREEDKK